MVYENERFVNVYLDTHDGRLRVLLVNKLSNKRHVMSYPKYLMENYLDRYLEEWETVDHIDKNPLNNNIENLQVLNRSTHSSLDGIKVKDRDYVCPFCNKTFTLPGSIVSKRSRGYKRRGITCGPFCSQSCAGKYGNLVYKNKNNKIYNYDDKIEYYCKKDFLYGEIKQPKSNFTFLNNNYSENIKLFLDLCRYYFGDIIENNNNLFKCNLFLTELNLAVFFDNSCFYDIDYKLNIINDIYIELKKAKDNNFNFFVLHDIKEYKYIRFTKIFVSLIKKYNVYNFNKVIDCFIKISEKYNIDVYYILNSFTEECYKKAICLLKLKKFNHNSNNNKTLESLRNDCKENYVDTKNLERIEIVKKSKVDFSKFGWVTKLAKELSMKPQKVNIWMKKYMPEFYFTKCFIRKNNNFRNIKF